MRFDILGWFGQGLCGRATGTGRSTETERRTWWRCLAARDLSEVDPIFIDYVGNFDDAELKEKEWDNSGYYCAYR